MRFRVYQDGRFASGAVAAGRTLTVYEDEAMATEATLYAAATGATTVANPYTVPATGIIDFWTADSQPWGLAQGDSTARPLRIVSGGYGAATVSVTDYGAKGDGSGTYSAGDPVSGTNDYAAIAAAIAAVQTDGGTVYFPPGTYRCDTAIDVPDGVSIVGAGPDVSWLWGAFHFGSNQHHRDIKLGRQKWAIRGSYTGASGVNEHTTFTNCRLHGGGAGTLLLDRVTLCLGNDYATGATVNNISHVTFTDCIIERSFTQYNTVSIIMGGAASTSLVEHVTFRGCHIGASNGNATTPVTISTSSGNEDDPITITTATAHGLAVGDPVYIDGHTGASPNDINGASYVVTVPTPTTFTVGNLSLGDYQNATGGTGGTCWRPDTGSSRFLVECWVDPTGTAVGYHDINFYDNTFEASDEVVLDFACPVVDGEPLAHSCRVVGNTFLGAGRAAWVRLAYGGGALAQSPVYGSCAMSFEATNNSVVSGNTFYRCQTEGIRSTSSVVGTAEMGNVISGNVFDWDREVNSEREVVAQTHPFINLSGNGWTVSGNTMLRSAAGYFVQLDGACRCVFSGNSYTQTVTSTYQPIRFTATSSPSSDNTFTGERIYQHGTETSLVYAANTCVDNLFQGCAFDCSGTLAINGYPFAVESAAASFIRKDNWATNAAGEWRLRDDVLRLSVAPASGTWAVGDIVYDITPSAEGYVGWVCTVAGTPGTWRGFGLIEADPA